MTTSTFSQLPAAGPITGAEVIPLMQNGVTVQSTVAAVAAGGVASLPLGAQSLSLKSANFANTTALAPMIANYQFGSAAVGGPGITTITNMTDLANNFNAFEDFTNLTSINSEIERYQPFNTSNHIINPSDLTMQVTNPGNDWQTTAITQVVSPLALTGTIPIASLGLATTSVIQVGQLVARQGGGGVGGLYMVASLVTDTSVTLTPMQGSNTASQTGGGLMFWLPIVGVALSAPYTNGGPSFTFSTGVPSFVQIGMACAVNASPLSNQVLNRSADTRVLGTTSTTVSIGPVGANLPNLGAGTIIWFFPWIASGQIWSKLQYDLTNPQTFFAIEAEMTCFAPVGATKATLGTNGQLTLAQFNTIPANYPFGGWPAFWMYSADDGNSSAETGSAAEIDMVEIQLSCTADGAFLNTGAVTYTGAATLMTKNDSGWTSFAAFGIAIAPSGQTFVSARNKYQYILCNGIEYRFFNGILYKARQFQWNNQRPTQFSVGIASGGMTPPLAMNTMFPNNPSGFVNSYVALNGVKVWYQAP